MVNPFSNELMTPRPALPPTAKPPRRWWRWALGAALLGTVGVGVAWCCRVPLANAALARLPGDFAVSITGLDPGLTSLDLRGVQVIHRGSGTCVFRAAALRAENSWPNLRKGRLGKLTATQPQLTWRENLASKSVITHYPVPPSPLLSYQSLRLIDGSLDISHGPVLRISVRALHATGGRLVIYDNDTIHAAEHQLELSDVTYAQQTPNVDVRIQSPRLAGCVTSDSAANHLTCRDLTLATPQLQLSLAQAAGSVTAASPDTASGAMPGAPPPFTFTLRNGTAPSGLLTLGVPPLAAYTAPFSLPSLRELTAGGAAGFTLSDASWELGPVSGAPGLDIQSCSGTAQLGASRLTLTRAELQTGAIDLLLACKSLQSSPQLLANLPGLTLASARLSLRDLVASAASSAAAQSVDLRGIALTAPGATEPVARIASVQATAIPSDFTTHRRLRSLTIESPEVTISPATQPPAPATPPPSSAASATAPGSPPDYLQGLHAEQLTITSGRWQLRDMGPLLPQAQGRLTLATAPLTAGGVPHYRLQIPEIHVASSTAPTEPFYTGHVEADLHPTKLWTDRAAAEVRINGSRPAINEALRSWLNSRSASSPQVETPAPAIPPPSTPDKQASSPSSSSPPLQVQRLIIEDTSLSIDGLGDGRRLQIPIPRQVFEDLTLGPTPSQPAAQRIYKVEIPGIYLYAPYQEGQKVVELPVNFISFSLAGLMQNRIERVELVAPTILAGKPLHTWVDATQKNLAHAHHPSRPLLASAAAPDDPTLPLRTALATAAAIDGWDIPIFTETGRVITAPNGIPWRQIPILPFRNSRDARGQPIPFLLHGDTVTGELSVGSGWYDFPEYKLRLKISEDARILFNYPMKDRNNNLVEVFKNNTLLWRGIEATEVWLSVTYDDTGIYVKFGGTSSGGYVNGAFNLYLDETYTWDANASFTGIELRDLTRRLSPDSFLATGQMDTLTLTAFGDMTCLYQLSADLTMKTGGRLQIPALDETRTDFTRDRIDWTDDAGRIAIDTLRDTTFTTCTGNAKLYGREGTLRLQLHGPHGGRDLTIHLHDYITRPLKSFIPF